ITKLNAIAIVDTIVSNYFGIKNLRSKQATRKIANARQIAMAISLLYDSSVQVGKYYKRDHTTVLHAKKAVHKDDALFKLYTELKEECIKTIGEGVQLQ